MSELVIRPMGEGDIPALCRAEGGETTENRECFERYLYWQQQLNDCVFLLAFFDGQLAGHLFVFYHDCPGGAESVDMPRLADLRVFEPFRRQGVGSALLKAGEQVASTINDHAFLTVDRDDPMHQAYERRGYYPNGKENEALVMVKKLKL